METKIGLRIAIVLGVLLPAPAAFSAAVIAPYSDTFDGTATGQPAANFVTDGSASWGVVSSAQGGGNAYQSSLSANAAFWSQVQASNLGSSQQNFTLSSTLDLTSISSNFTLGFSALASSSNLVSADYYLADVQQDGTIRLLYFEGGGVKAGTGQAQTSYNGFSVNTGTNLGVALAANTSYTLTLQGTYIGGTLDLSLTLTDGTHTALITGADTSPLAESGDDWFGYRGRENLASPLSVQFDNFQIVPEPSSMALGAAGMAILGGLGCLFRRRAGVARA